MSYKKSKSLFKKIDKKAYFIFTLPAIILYSVFFLYPVVKGILYSFTDWNGINRTYKMIGFDNYLKLFSDYRIQNSLSFTFKYSIALVILTVIIAMLIAILLNQKIKFRTSFRTVYFFPAVLSMIMVGLIWNQIFLHVLPSIGKFLHIKMISRNILSNPDLAFYGVLFVSLWKGIAIPIVLFLAGLQSVPQELIEAAAIDGATGWETFFKVKFPFIIPVLNIVIILTVKGGLTTFDYIVAMTQGGPGKVTESLGLLIYNFAFKEFKFSYANSLAVVLFIIIAIVSLIQVKGMSRYEVNS